RLGGRDELAGLGDGAAGQRQARDQGDLFGSGRPVMREGSVPSMGGSAPADVGRGFSSTASPRAADSGRHAVAEPCGQLPGATPRLIRVVHVPFGFFPDPVGGTEVYVRGLARGLRALGVVSFVAAPGDRDTTYDHNGLMVRRFRLGSVSDTRDL